MQKTLIGLLSYLVKREANGWQLYGTSDLSAREWVALDFNPIEEAVIPEAARAHPQHGDVFGYTGQWLFLPAPKKGPLRIPVLNVLWNRAIEPNRVSYQLAVFYPRREEAPMGRVWRFESPEGADSVHGYFHAQPSHALRTCGGDIAVRTGDEEIPEGAPTIPVDADGEISLFVALLVAVYGLIEAADLVRDVGDPGVAECLHAMRSSPAMDA